MFFCGKMYQRMMDDISKQIKAGEVSGVQFKERILDKYDIACELVAFSNSQAISYLSRMRSLNCTPDTSPAFICFNISSIIL